METIMANRRVAEVFPPGEFIKEELEARGWSQLDLAEIIGTSPVNVNRILQGNQAITPETAKKLAEAFGTSAQLWLNLESEYQLSLVDTGDNDVGRRAKLYDLFPVREMLKRHWVEPSENIDVLEKRFCDFFGIGSLNETPTLAHAPRKSTRGELTPAQRAWMFRAYQLAQGVSASPFSERTLKTGLERIKLLLTNAEDVRHVPRVLAESGVRLVVVEALPNSRIDGVCFWLDKHSPVIALSIRYDRIDGFWYTLMHECGHVLNRDGLNEPVFLDTDLVGDEAQPFAEKPEEERRADEFSCDFLVKKAEMDRFIVRIHPLYSKQKIKLFANRIKVHPGIVVGQLHHRNRSFSQHREMLEKVRNIITSSALTDGWGNTPPV